MRDAAYTTSAVAWVWSVGAATLSSSCFLLWEESSALKTVYYPFNPESFGEIKYLNHNCGQEPDLWMKVRACSQGSHCAKVLRNSKQFSTTPVEQYMNQFCCQDRNKEASLVSIKISPYLRSSKNIITSYKKR